MAINSIGTPIALQIRPLNLLRAEELKGARMQNEAAAQEMQRANALQSFYQQNGAGILNGDQNALTGLAGIDPKAAMDVRGAQLEAQKREMDANLTRLKAIGSSLDAILNAPDGADHQALYDQQKRYLSGLGIPVDDTPPQWDPAWAQTVRDSTLTASERLERTKSDPAYLARVEMDKAKAQAAAKAAYPTVADAPSGYRNLPNGTQTFIPGGPADPDVIKRNAVERREAIVEIRPPTMGPNAKPMPVGIQRAEDADLEAIGIASSIQSDLRQFQDQIQNGQLSLGPVNNTISEIQNALGRSSEGSRNYASFRATLERLRNDSLRLNKGVQTEGDATRAWNELFRNISDEGVVLQRLGEIQGINARAAKLRQQQIDIRRQRNKAEPFDWTGFEVPQSPYATPQSNGGWTIEIEKP